MVLTNPFPQQQKMITQVPAPPPEGNAESSTEIVMTVKSMVALKRRANNYDSAEGEPSSKDPPLILPPNGSLTFVKSTSEHSILPPKGVPRRTPII
jgi:hypothetical protein